MEMPLAYFITFHTYGTWLPGDPRGSVDARRSWLGASYVRSQSRHASSVGRLEQPPVTLGDRERTVVLAAIEEVCRHRGWVLRAAHVRTNHLHVVVTAENTPERVMNDLKAWSTRRIVDAALRPRGRSTLGPPRQHALPLLVGDTCHTVWGWEHDVEPGEFTGDQGRNAISLARLRRLAREHPKMRVWLGHQRLAGTE